MDARESRLVGLPTEQEMRTFLARFVQALGPLATGSRSPSAVADMASTISQLEEFRERAASVPALRPNTGAVRAVIDSTNRFSALWPTYAAALTASTISEAERLGQAGQAIIDAALAGLDEYSRMGAAIQILQDPSAGDFIDRTLKLVDVLYPDTSLLEVAASGAREAGRRTGVPVDDANGAHYLLLRAVGSVSLDGERLNLVLSAAARFCAASPRLNDIAAMQGALLGLAASSRAVFEAFAAFEAVLHAKLPEEALLRRMIKLYGETFEDVGGPVFAWYALLSGAKSQPYRKLVGTDTSAIFSTLSKTEAVSTFFHGVNPHLRNAAHHGSSYVVEGEVVRFTLRSWSGTLTPSQIVDELLTLIESIAATTWGLSTALTSAGVEVPTLPGSVGHDGGFRFARNWLEGRGAGLLDASESDRSWSFTVTGPSPTPFRLAYVLASQGSPPPAEVTVRWKDPRSRLSVKWGVVHAYMSLAGTNDSNALDLLLALIALRHACRSAEGSLVEESDLLYASSAQGLRLLNGSVEMVPHLRSTLDIAKSERYDSVVASIRRTFQSYRGTDERGRQLLADELKTNLRDLRPPTEPEADEVTCIR